MDEAADQGTQQPAWTRTVAEQTMLTGRSGPMRVTHGLYNLGVQGDHFEVLFSLAQGSLVSYRYAGRELFERVPRPEFWRAMTDNDTENQLPFRAGQWKAAGLYASPKYHHGRKMDTCLVEEFAEGALIRRIGQVTEKGAGQQPADGQEGKTPDLIRVTFPYHLPVKPATDAFMIYTVHPCGTVDVSLKMGPSDQVGQLPAFCVLFTLNADFDHFKWYGIGPSDTYVDRNHGKLGIYHSLVKDQLAKYLVPQECGNKTQVRWAQVTDEKGRGLLVLSDGLDVSALPWTAQELDNARHPNELPPVYHTYVRVGRQMGVGGDDTWGALVHPEYLLDNSRQMQIRFSFRGI